MSKVDNDIHSFYSDNKSLDKLSEPGSANSGSKSERKLSDHGSVLSANTANSKTSVHGSTLSGKDLVLIKSLLKTPSGDEDTGNESSDLLEERSSFVNKGSTQNSENRTVIHLDDEPQVQPKKSKRKKKKTAYKRTFTEYDLVDNETKLQEKYGELYVLLNGTFNEHRGKVSEDLKALKKKAFSVYSQQRPLRAPAGKPPAIRRPLSAVYNKNGCNNINDDIILIDTTEGKKGTTKLVSFQDSPSPLRPSSAHVNGVHANRGRGITRTKNAPARSNSASKSSLRPQSATTKTNHTKFCALNGNRSRSTSIENDKLACEKKKSRRSPSVSSSGSSSKSRSRSRSQEKPPPQSDHQLKKTDNPILLEWLKKKNKLLKLQRAEVRKRRREERKKKIVEEKKKAENQEVSEKKVRQWFASKRKSERLLKKRSQMENSPVKAPDIDDTEVSGEVVEEETVDLRDTQSNEETQVGIEGMNERQDEKACSCDTLKLKEALDRQKRMLERQRVTSARLAKKLAESQSALDSPRRSARSPARKTSPCAVDENRRSYDNWLKTKRKKEAETKLLEKEVERRKLAALDPESAKLVSEVGRRRAENVRRGKKKIETGVSKIDEDANSHLDSSMQASQNFLLEGEVTRPISAQPVHSKAHVSLKQRPASARATTKKPLSVSYPAPSKKRSKSPIKPEVVTGRPYEDVKYQQKSWDNFSDHIWEKLNEEGNDDDSTRPEPQGSETPDLSSDGRTDEGGSVPGTGENSPTENTSEGNMSQTAEAEVEPNTDLESHNKPEEIVTGYAVEDIEEVLEENKTTNEEGDGVDNEQVTLTANETEEGEIQEKDSGDQISEETGKAEGGNLAEAGLDDKESGMSKEEKHVHFAEVAEEIEPDDSAIESENDAENIGDADNGESNENVDQAGNGDAIEERDEVQQTGAESSEDAEAGTSAELNEVTEAVNEGDAETTTAPDATIHEGCELDDASVNESQS